KYLSQNHGEKSRLRCDLVLETALRGRTETRRSPVIPGRPHRLPLRRTTAGDAPVLQSGKTNLRLWPNRHVPVPSAQSAQPQKSLRCTPASFLHLSSSCPGPLRSRQRRPMLAEREAGSHAAAERFALRAADSFFSLLE